MIGTVESGFLVNCCFQAMQRWWLSHPKLENKIRKDMRQMEIESKRARKQSYGCVRMRTIARYAVSVYVVEDILNIRAHNNRCSRMKEDS